MMTGEGTIMQTMTKPRPKKQTTPARTSEGEGRKPRQGRPIMFYLDDHTGAAMDAFQSAQRFPPTTTDIMTVALQEFLKREGFLNPERKS
jgi:hypothetical protein